MTEPKVLVDLDGTLTRTELLPVIARSAGIEEEITRLTDDTLAGRIPFAESFRRRVGMLSGVPIELVHEAILGAPLFEELMALLLEHPERVMVVTGNLDVWVQPFLDRHGLEGMTSTATRLPGGGTGVGTILNKAAAVRQHEGRFRIAIGDGANDASMVRGVEVGVAWCGVHRAADSLMEVAGYAFASERTLCRFLRRWW
ncbi:HAD family hydrolase [Blastococcus sp. CT_GayMR20]|uniref:HAD-IB family phosphatase n=1 Tax=Blastococcus sp. CT_GayMR20 TaxID=2559609 RepID=UPI0010748BBD|nr:HAD-IB family phosphatase [Blastococcus sp. CT_GayMR20]TFV83252.1 HAD family hydrolase [Blastococcus sp. CT_GayMR20]